MKFLSKQISYTRIIKKQLLIGLLLGIFLAFILIFLEPFNTNNFISSQKNFLLAGYGILLFMIYLVYTRIENLWYKAKNNIWLVKDEIISILSFFIVSGSIIYMYNEFLINKSTYSFLNHIRYLRSIILPFMLIFSPLLVYLRHKLGELILPKLSNEILLKGINKNETLRILKEDLLFVKASENYIEIYFASNNSVHHKTFRNTLSEIAKQAPFVEQCHRSYLVNTSKVKQVKGNSQKASLIFDGDLEIPLSKSFYKKFKSSLSI